MFYCLSPDQATHVIASENDGIWYNETTNKEIDLDSTY